jgi:exodeoxyribonuclease VII small subunit
MSSQDTLNFEKAFSRLEEILEKMNSGAIALDESIALYEEANSLIQFCNKKLIQAETKVEMLVKTREGDLELGQNGAPLTEPFSYSTSQLQG